MENTSKRTRSKHTNTQSELAERFGVTDRSISRWLRLPGAPKRTARGYCVADWERFVEEKSLRPSTGQIELLALRKRKLLAECERLDDERGRRRDQLISRELAGDAIRHIASGTIAILRQKLEVELPSELVGLDICAIRAKQTAVVDAVIDQCSHILDDWSVEKNNATEEIK